MFSYHSQHNSSQPHFEAHTYTDSYRHLISEHAFRIGSGRRWRIASLHDAHCTSGFVTHSLVVKSSRNHGGSSHFFRNIGFLAAAHSAATPAFFLAAVILADASCGIAFPTPSTHGSDAPGEQLSPLALAAGTVPDFTPFEELPALAPTASLPTPSDNAGVEELAPLELVVSGAFFSVRHGFDGVLQNSILTEFCKTQ